MAQFRERDLQRLALRLADAMREDQGKGKHPRPSSGVSDAGGRPPIDTARYKRGVTAAIAAFHHAYTDTNMDTMSRDPAGQDEKVDEGEETGDAGTGDGAMGGMGGSRMEPGSMVTSSRDQRAGDKMAAEGDPEYQDEWADDDPEDDLEDSDKPANWVDDMPRMSRAGRDMSKNENDAVRHAKPNTRRFAQAKSDQAAFTKYFDGSPKKSEVKRAGYRCSQCGESQVVRKYAVAESTALNALRLTTAKCSQCGGKNVVRAPEGFAYTSEAAAVFSTRYRRESL